MTILYEDYKNDTQFNYLAETFDAGYDSGNRLTIFEKDTKRNVIIDINDINADEKIIFIGGWSTYLGGDVFVQTEDDLYVYGRTGLHNEFVLALKLHLPTLETKELINIFKTIKNDSKIGKKLLLTGEELYGEDISEKSNLPTWLSNGRESKVSMAVLLEDNHIFYGEVERTWISNTEFRIFRSGKHTNVFAPYNYNEVSKSVFQYILDEHGNKGTDKNSKFVYVNQTNEFLALILDKGDLIIEVIGNTEKLNVERLVIKADELNGYDSIVYNKDLIYRKCTGLTTTYVNPTEDGRKIEQYVLSIKNIGKNEINVVKIHDILGLVIPESKDLNKMITSQIVSYGHINDELQKYLEKNGNFNHVEYTYDITQSKYEHIVYMINKKTNKISLLVFVTYNSSNNVHFLEDVYDIDELEKLANTKVFMNTYHNGYEIYNLVHNEYVLTDIIFRIRSDKGYTYNKYNVEDFAIIRGVDTFDNNEFNDVLRAIDISINDAGNGYITGLVYTYNGGSEYTPEQRFIRYENNVVIGVYSSLNLDTKELNEKYNQLVTYTPDIYNNSPRHYFNGFYILLKEKKMFGSDFVLKQIFETDAKMNLVGKGEVIGIYKMESFWTSASNKIVCFTNIEDQNEFILEPIEKNLDYLQIKKVNVLAKIDNLNGFKLVQI